MAYLMPTSWAGMEMDWEAPDATNPVYLRAIDLALQERKLAQIYGGGAVFNLSYDRHQPHGVFNVAWARKIADDILDLMVSGIGFGEGYMLPNPDAEEAETTPLVAAGRVLGQDPQIAALHIPAGDLLSGAATTAFLKACKHFLDRLSIISYDADDAYFVCDYWSALDPQDALGGWGELWSYFIANATVQSDVLRSGTLGARFAYTTSSYADANLRYRPRHAIAHKLMGSISTVLGGFYEYNYFFDSAGTGLQEGFTTIANIPPGGNLVAIGDTTPQPPASYGPWAYQADGPHANNTAYRCQIKVLAADFACEGGFNFREETP